MTPQPIVCFRPGRHVAMSGQALEFSAQDIADLADRYDPALHEAPIVVGHPATDAPAYGWVARLDAPAGELQAHPRQVLPEFAEAVRAGRYKKVSISLWGPEAPGNPKPGGYYLRHLGFLGAAAPAIKGLPPVQFSGGDDGVLTWEFSEPGAWSISKVVRNLREWLLTQFGVETADRVVPDYMAADLEQVAAQPGEDEPPPAVPMTSFAQGDAMSADERARLAELEAENTRLKVEAQAADDARAAAAAEARRAGIVSYVEALAAEGRSLLTRRRAAVVELLAALPADQQLSFAQGEATATVGAEALAREILAALPKDVPLGEAAPRGAPAKDRAEFSEHDWAATIDAHVAEFHSTTAEAVAAIRDGWRHTK